MDQEKVTEFLNGLKILDNAINSDKFNMELIWRTIDTQLNRTYFNSEPLSELIDNIFGSPAGRAIERIITEEFSEIDPHLINNRFFYISIRKNFGFNGSVKKFV
ncbi:hypothetical protein [Paenibacillus azoreducens]|uniref:Uncharacterized protein n=1 Tax=Paenibacillus azoreducens TaxID=116718 RepID=A0A919YLL3_9BACL|nr:hypothetical protein [Paenibacillus azoreducens]GIO51650.1 hypothetical protein J34TS1_64150 [Paenibacillus azoreducens]